MNPISGLRILPAETDFAPVSKLAPPDANPGSNFGDVLQAAVQQVDAVQGDASNKVSELIAGQGGDIHNAMIAVEQADLSFQLMLQVRNKMVAAYQEVSRMQF